jgi:flagellar hook-associated protein 2
MTTSSSTSTSSLLSSLTNSTASSGSLITTGELDVAQLVSELMVVQSQPLTQLESQVSGIQSTLSAYGQVQSALSTLQSAAAALALPSAFQAASATVTGSGVSATVTGDPSDATYTVDVSSLAQGQSIASAAVSDPSAAQGTGTLTIQLGSYDSGTNTFTAQSGSSAITVNISSSNDTLSGIAAAINSAAGGAVNASVVTQSDGSAQLVISSGNTGADNGFTVTASSGLSQFGYDPTSSGTQGMSQTQAAADASFSVNGLAMTSASNSVTTAISGVTLNLTQAPASGGTPLQSEVSVGMDPGAVSSTVQSFVTAYNSLISLTNTLTNYDASSNTASELTGDPTTRQIVGTLQSIVGSPTTASGTSASTSYLAEIGISTNADGTLDTTQFESALEADPSAVAAMFTTATGSGSSNGFAVQVSQAAQQMIDSGGALSTAQQGLQSEITYDDGREATMQAQLAQTQQALTQEYSALNAELAVAQQQQTSLANELAQLPG